MHTPDDVVEPGTSEHLNAESFADAESRLRLLRLADELARFAQPPAKPSPPAPPSKLRFGVRSFVQRLFLGTEEKPRPSATHNGAAVMVGDTLDVGWADASPAFEDVVHIFHQEWHGIRAAAGYLPGQKVAISAEQRLSLANLQTVVDVCARRRGRTALLHGWSENMNMAVQALRKTLGTSVKLKVVWHGNTSQFINEYELRQAIQLVDLKRKGVLDGLGSVKPDLHLMSDAFNPETLLNVAPSRVASVTRSGTRDAALIPVPLDWRKNLHTNLFAAAAAGVGRVFVTADRVALPAESFGLKSTVVPVVRPSRQALFTLISTVDLILNASLSECQPMTALEGLALGVPCITGLLALDQLDNHPYQRLVQVPCTDTLGPVVRAIRSVNDQWNRDARGFSSMMADYEQVLRREAFARLERFLG